MVKKYFKEIYFTSICLVIILLDQITKYLVYYFQPNLNLKILAITFVKNTGAGFGILKGQTLFLAIVSLLVAFAVIFYYKRIPVRKIPQTLFAVFLGGVIGNLIDRLFRGHVIDFIDLKLWPTFNIADMAISIAVVGIIIYFWKER